MSDTKHNDFSQEMPTVTTLLKRKKLTTVQGGAEQPAMPTPPKTEGTKSNLKVAGNPPVFKGKLHVEKTDLKTFEKQLSKHKKYPDLKKLDCIGFLSSFFDEVAFYTTSMQGFKGVLGFGTTLLVTKTAANSFTAQSLPIGAHMASSGDCYAGPIVGLPQPDQNGFKALGFQATNSVGVFPIMQKKVCAGVWVCASNKPVSFDAKQMKALKKVFAGIKF